MGRILGRWRRSPGAGFWPACGQRRVPVLLFVLFLLLSGVFAGPRAAAQPFAFGLHGPDRGVLPLHAPLARTTGAEAVPVRFEWREVEPSPGRFLWARQEAFIEAARDRDLRVVGVLTYPEDMPLPVGSGPSTGWPSGHPDDWTFFVSRVLARFRNEVDGWVIEGPWGGEGTDVFQAAGAERYAAFVRITGGAVRRSEPRKPLLAVVPGNDILWLRLFIEYGGLAAVDGFALDVNRWPAPPSGLGVAVSYVREAAQEAGENPLLWAWRFGYPTDGNGGLDSASAALSGYAESMGPPGVDEETQARYLVESHVRLLAAGVAAVFYDGLIDRSGIGNGHQSSVGNGTLSTGGNDPAGRFGLLRANFSRKPAARAYETMTAMLHGLHYARVGDVIQRPMLPGTGDSPQDAADSETDATPAAAAEGAADLARLREADQAADLAQDVSGLYHFVFDYELFEEQLAATGDVAAAHVFTGERGTVIVVWTEERVGGGDGCRDGCGQRNILPWLDGVPVRAFDMNGAAVLEQTAWIPGRDPLYIELPMELVP